MGAAGCFGGPLFNLLVGTGVGLSVHTLSKGTLCWEFDKTAPVGLVFLLGSLAVTLVWVPLNGWKLTRNFGIFHVCYYVAFTVISLLISVTDPPFLDAQLSTWYGVNCPPGGS